ncbi:MAG: SDR family oxidoreductase [Chloroflexi bacterium]|nr:SDR family oxidoreductase [Chloroflexota bacterium]
MNSPNRPSSNKRSVPYVGLGITAAALGALAIVRRMAGYNRGNGLFGAEWQGDRRRRALVTGASSGIGAAFARRLAAEGYDLTLVARRIPRLQALANELAQQFGTNAEVFPADLSQPAEVERVEKHIAGMEALDLLINDAGYSVPGTYAEGDLTQHLDLIHVHILASMRLTRAALPGMIARRSGGLILVSSLAAFAPAYGLTSYSASKAYLSVFAEALFPEVKAYGIHVQALCPGLVMTEFQDNVPGSYRAPVPRPMLLTPDQVARESLAALANGPVVFVPGTIYRVVAPLVRSAWFSPVVKLIMNRMGRTGRYR